MIETTNFTDRTGIGGNGNGAVHSEELRSLSVSRASTTTPCATSSPSTIRDLHEPWTVRFDLDPKPGYEIYEYACHEGNYGLRIC